MGLKNTFAGSEPAATPPAKSTFKVLFACCLAHLTHDGLTDMLYVFFPIWQQLYSLSYFEVGLLKTVFSGSMAFFQLPAGKLGNRVGIAPTLIAGTFITSLALIGVGSTSELLVMGGLLFLGGIGSSAQHPLASSAISGAYTGQGRRAALSAYNFTGDVGKLLFPSLAAFIIARYGWQAAIRSLGCCGLLVALIEAVSLAGAAVGRRKGSGEPGKRFAFKPSFPFTPAFSALCAIGVLDGATRVGLLTYLPFLLRDKGADVTTLGLALGLTFAGGAAGKLICGVLASRGGILRSVILTEAATAAGILGMIVLPLTGELILCPLLGVVLNGTSSVLYGSVPELVEPKARNEAFAVFYTAGIGAGAASPFIYGLLGDAAGVPVTLTVVAVMVLLTLPCTLPLRGKLAHRG